MSHNFLGLGPEDHVLFLGEGNFSFSLAYLELLQKQSMLCPSSVVCTCFEDEPVSDLAKDNMNQLLDHNWKVELGVDATDLHNIFEGKKFDKIVFMFPHTGGKMKIQKNRQLLKEFAQSCQQVLTRQGQVMVGLCAGQGGTDFDTKSRIEADSWQIGKMMAFGELQAVEIAPLDLSELNNYTSFGYRSLDKGFHIENSILHVFEPSQFGIALVDDYDFLQDKLQALNHGDFKGRTMMNELRHKIRAENETCEELPPLAGEWADLKALIVKSSDVVSFQFFLLFCPSTCFNANPLKFLLVTNHLTLKFEVMIKDDASPCQVFDISTCFGQSNTTWRHFWTLQPNLCPLSTFHDLSFWLPSPDSKIDFSLDLVNDFYWRHAGDFVANLEVIDDSFEKRGKKSWTIRLHYLIFKTAMSLTTLWDFHYNKLGRKLAKSFGLELR